MDAHIGSTLLVLSDTLRAEDGSRSATNAEGRSNRFHAACAVGHAASRGRLAVRHQRGGTLKSVPRCLCCRTRCEPRTARGPPPTRRDAQIGSTLLVLSDTLRAEDGSRSATNAEGRSNRFHTACAVGHAASRGRLAVRHQRGWTLKSVPRCLCCRTRCEPRTARGPPPTRRDAQIGSTLLVPSDALRAEDGSRSATNADGRSNRFHAACAVGHAASRGRLAVRHQRGWTLKSVPRCLCCRTRCEPRTARGPPPTRRDAQIGSTLLVPSDALRAEDGSRSATNAEGRSNRFHAACAVGHAASRGRLAVRHQRGGTLKSVPRCLCCRTRCEPRTARGPPPTRRDAQIGSTLLVPSDALRAQDGSRSATNAEGRSHRFHAACAVGYAASRGRLAVRHQRGGTLKSVPHCLCRRTRCEPRTARGPPPTRRDAQIGSTLLVPSDTLRAEDGSRSATNAEGRSNRFHAACAVGRAASP